MTFFNLRRWILCFNVTPSDYSLIVHHSHTYYLDRTRCIHCIRPCASQRFERCAPTQPITLGLGLGETAVQHHWNTIETRVKRNIPSLSRQRHFGSVIDRETPSQGSSIKTITRAQSSALACVSSPAAFRLWGLHHCAIDPKSSCSNLSLREWHPIPLVSTPMMLSIRGADEPIRDSNFVGPSLFPDSVELHLRSTSLFLCSSLCCSNKLLRSTFIDGGAYYKRNRPDNLRHHRKSSINGRYWKSFASRYYFDCIP